jgi:hypothetical protein
VRFRRSAQDRSANDRVLGDAGAICSTAGGNDVLTGDTQRDSCRGGAGRDAAVSCEVRSSISSVISVVLRMRRATRGWTMTS